MMNLENQAELYMSFAAVFHRPGQEVVNHLEELIELWAGYLPNSKEALQGLSHFCQVYPLGELRLNVMWEHYIPLFETGEVEAPPYASVYLGEEALVLGEESFKVKDYYAQCGFGIGDDSELPDHLAVELEFCALLARNGRDIQLQDFERVHLFPFLSRILPQIIEAKRPVYSEVALILKEFQLNLQKVGDFVG